jgi:3-isopropylmalate/(R)-2-methylmalate dehydratase small subunit
MEFTVLKGVAAPLLRANIDTDAIIPGDQLLRVDKSGFGDGLFANWRYDNPAAKDRRAKPEFPLNREPYRKAVILLAGVNFACGSSREPAVWALRDFGIRCVIAPSFGHIFYANCFNSALLPCTLPIEAVEEIARQVEASDGAGLVTVDLRSRQVAAPDGRSFDFQIAENYRQMLLEGLDHIDATLRFERDINAYQRRDRERRPWVYERPR